MVALPRWMVVVALGLASLVPLWAGLASDHQLLGDDSLITLTYAKNLARGSGFVFNHPPPSLGTTTPLYALLLAALSRLMPFLPMTQIAVWVGVLCWIALVWAFYWWRQVFRLSELDAVVVGLAIASSGWVRYLGMEATLFALLLVAGLASALRGMHWLSGVLCFLLFLTRGEGVLLFAILLLWNVYREVRSKAVVEQGRLGPTVRLTIGFALPLMVWVGYAWPTFGNIFPNTLSAKVAQVESGLWRPFLSRLVGEWAPGWGRGLGIANIPYLNAWYLFAVVGLVSALRRRREIALLLLWVVAYVAGYAILGVAAYPWYAIPMHFVLNVMFAVGVATAAARIVRMTSARWARVGIGCIVLGLMSGVAWPTVDDIVRGTTSDKDRAYYELAQWIDGHVPADASVAYHEVGYLGFYTENPIVDLMGLVSPDLTSHVSSRDFGAGFWDRRPEVFIYLEGSRFLAMAMQRPAFAAEYLPIAVLPGFDQKSITVFCRVDSMVSGIEPGSL
jgi:arabinofuranosyltransferase